MQVILVLAGWGQLLLAAASLAIPSALAWREQLGALPPLTRQVFWTYAAYIWGTNVAMGLVSALAPYWLLDGSPLARAVCAYIGLYWGARLGIQLGLFGRHAPPGVFFRLAELGMLLLFAALTAVFAAVALGAR